jgi:hypothetical protein
MLKVLDVDYETFDQSALQLAIKGVLIDLWLEEIDHEAVCL